MQSASFGTFSLLCLYDTVDLVTDLVLYVQSIWCDDKWGPIISSSQLGPMLSVRCVRPIDLKPVSQFNRLINNAHDTTLS